MCMFFSHVFDVAPSAFSQVHSCLPVWVLWAALAVLCASSVCVRIVCSVRVLVPDVALLPVCRVALVQCLHNMSTKLLGRKREGQQHQSSSQNMLVLFEDSSRLGTTGIIG